MDRKETKGDDSDFIQGKTAMETMTGLVRPMRLERTTFRVGV